MLRRILAALHRWDVAASRWVALAPEVQQQRGWPYWLALLGAHLGDSWLWGVVGLWEWGRTHHLPGISKASRKVADKDAPCTAVIELPRSRSIRRWSLALWIAFVANMLLKQQVKRPRPGTGHWLYGPGPDGYSFPSGHAMRMGVIAVWSGTLWPGSSWLMGLLTLWISWSRVRLGIHYAGDVVVGLVLGWLIGRSLRRR